MNFCVLNFTDQQCLSCSVARVFNFTIFPKKSQNSISVCVFVCVCVFFFVCAYVYVCINVTSQNNVIVATCKTKHRVLLFKMWRISKVHKLKIKKNHFNTTQNFTCLKCCYISLLIKTLYTLKQWWKRVIICTAF